MPPEKVAVLVITGVIAVLVSVTLMKSSERSDRRRDAGWPEPSGSSWTQEGRPFSRAEVLDGSAATRLQADKRVVREIGGGGGAATEPPHEAPGASRLHRIVRGDTLEDLARRYLGGPRDVPRLLAANPGIDPRRLQLGQEIHIPPPAGGRENVADDPPGRQDADAGGGRWYVVVPGDRLESVAQEFYGRRSLWRRIFEANRGELESPDALQPGQRLRIP